MQNKGFTLIELLVVIAIIGILSGLIIVSMGGAQGAAKDARIKAALDQFRSNAEVFRLGDASSRYGIADVTAGAACPSSGTNIIYAATGAGADGALLCADIQLQNANALLFNISSSSTTPRYCIQKTLYDNSTKWCVDSTGYAGTTANCDSTNFNCI
jgi:prepilin-type N-terminal cleavage/methylation domain-containing protein